VYCKTSDSPEDRAEYKHMSAIFVEKGTPGFTVEAIHDVMGRFGSRHAVLNFDNVRVPKENLILSEGDGWRVMIDALNIERLGVAAGAIGVARAALEATSDYVTKRIQFDKTLAEIPAVQTMGSDMVTGINLMSLITYYTAHKLDQGHDVPIGASISKLFATESLMKTTLDAIQCHGGDGYTTQYPVERHMRDSKLIEIGAGTNQILRTLIWRQWQKEHRALKESMRKPITESTVSGPDAKDKILEVMAEYYRHHPGLYMERYEIMEKVGLNDQDLEENLNALGAEKLVAVHRVRGMITLARATYTGLKKAKPQEYYLFIPDFVDKEKEIF